MDSGPIFLFYAAGKFVAYAAWCYSGLRLLQQKNSAKSALGFGLLRLILGVVFGVGVFLVGGIMHLEVPVHPVMMYFAIYAPVRYVEWSILALLLLTRGALRAGYSRALTQLWILGGIIVSHLADLPLILLSGEGAKGFLPVGRFLC